MINRKGTYYIHFGIISEEVTLRIKEGEEVVPFEERFFLINQNTKSLLFTCIESLIPEFTLHEHSSFIDERELRHSYEEELERLVKFVKPLYIKEDTPISFYSSFEYPLYPKFYFLERVYSPSLEEIY